MDNQRVIVSRPGRRGAFTGNDVAGEFKVYMFTAFAPDITLGSFYHSHRQSIEVTEDEALSLRWFHMRDKQRYRCAFCGKKFVAQGGQFSYTSNQGVRSLIQTLESRPPCTCDQSWDNERCVAHGITI